MPREQTVYAIEALSATGQVELDKDYVERPLPDTRELRDAINRAQRLIARYPGLLPKPKARIPVVASHPEKQALSALATLRLCIAARLRLRRRLRDIGRRLHRLRLLQRCINAMGEAAGDLIQIRGGDFLYHAIFACPTDVSGKITESLPGAIRHFADANYHFYTVFCLHDDRRDHTRAFRSAHCELVDIPVWLIDDWARRNSRIQLEIHRLRVERTAITQAIVEQQDDHRLASALNELSVLDWYLRHTVLLSEDRRHCHVTGWTAVPEPTELQRALERARIDAKILFRPIPPGHPPPIDLADGLLLRPFRQFVQMFGTPGPGEVDPTPLVAVLVPILFGFMFADVGHGLVLSAASLLLWRRYPQTRFLLTCGLSAAGFGLLFGETFGLHSPAATVLPCPLDAPLDTILASIVFGALVLLLGLALSAIEAAWRGGLREWMWQDGAVLTLYTSGLVSLIYPPALAAVALALLWYLVGLGITGRRLIPGMGRLALSGLELTLNTLSFARVGAFAVAHTALTHSVLEIATQFDQKAVEMGVLLVGHASIIIFEGLVVYVQTTRLILFEFFTRFLRAEGRLFRPLSLSTEAPD